MTKPLIVGPAPGPSGNGEPLAGRSGKRLASLCSLSLDEYLARFDRTNLLDHFPGKAGKGDRWISREEARELAQAMRPRLAGRVVIILGFANAAAFSITHPALRFAPHWEGIFAVCPHPSGVNLWWNDPANVRRARRFWRQALRFQ